MNQKENHFSNGFKKYLKEVGETPTDKEWKEKFIKYEKEIKKFLEKHPYLRKKIN